MKKNSESMVYFKNANEVENASKGIMQRELLFSDTDMNIVLFKNVNEVENAFKGIMQRELSFSDTDMNIVLPRRSENPPKERDRKIAEEFVILQDNGNNSNEFLLVLPAQFDLDVKQLDAVIAFIQARKLVTFMEIYSDETRGFISC